ncbi:MAG: NRDE family protein, partial [Candidatus Binataceae bacterium]
MPVGVLPIWNWMCTLAIFYKTARDWPVIVAANRDDFLVRPALAPTTLLQSPHVVGGKDLKAGGTWLGVNEHGLVAGLLNRHVETTANPNARSRGLLCLDVLRNRTAAEALAYVRTQRAADYNPFNLLIATRDDAVVAYHRAGAIESATLTPGLHLLTNLDLDDFECPRISRSYGRFAALGESAGFLEDP